MKPDPPTRPNLPNRAPARPPRDQLRTDMDSIFFFFFFRVSVGQWISWFWSGIHPTRPTTTYTRLIFLLTRSLTHPLTPIFLTFHFSLYASSFLSFHRYIFFTFHSLCLFSPLSRLLSPIFTLTLSLLSTQSRLSLLHGLDLTEYSQSWTHRAPQLWRDLFHRVVRVYSSEISPDLKRSCQIWWDLFRSSVILAGSGSPPIE